MAKTPAALRPTYALLLRPEIHVEKPDLALRAALKCLLRRYGLRAIDAREAE